MKNKISLIVISFVVVIVVLFGCRSRDLPSGALDSTPTPTHTPPVAKLHLTLQDDGDPAAGVDVRLHYPNDYDRYETGTMSDNGDVTITARAHGIFELEIMRDVIHGYAESLFYDVELKGSLTEKTIDRGAPEIYVSIDPALNPT